MYHEEHLPVLDVLPHDTHPSPVVDDDEDDGDPGHEDDRQADGGRVLVSLRVKVRVGGQPDAGVKNLDTTLTFSIWTHAAQLWVTRVQVIGTLTRLVINSTCMTRVVAVAKWTVLVTVLSKPVSFAETPTINM